MVSVGPEKVPPAPGTFSSWTPQRPVSDLPNLATSLTAGWFVNAPRRVGAADVQDIDQLRVAVDDVGARPRQRPPAERDGAHQALGILGRDEQENIGQVAGRIGVGAPGDLRVIGRDRDTPVKVSERIEASSILRIMDRRPPVRAHSFGRIAPTLSKTTKWQFRGAA
jgi:hypothetical protein